MKRCPTCDRSFEDSLKFCQMDGTPLVDAAASDDSFKTVVGNFSNEENAGSGQPDNYNSPSAPIEPFSQTPFNNPSSPRFDDFASSDYGAPSAPPFREPESSFNQSPFGNASANQTEWMPPPAPVSGWQNQNLDGITPFQSPVIQGQDKTLAIVSLVCGILSLTCCGPVTGIVALVTGFIAKNKIDAEPLHYTGRGMALAGMITGGISILLTILYIVFAIVGGVLR